MAASTHSPPRGRARRKRAAQHERGTRRRPRPLHRNAALYRPGRFFQRNKKLDHYRLHMNPRHLGEADWLLYRRRFNPYPTRWRAHQAYEAGFHTAKREIPKPDWPAINW